LHNSIGKATAELDDVNVRLEEKSQRRKLMAFSKDSLKRKQEMHRLKSERFCEIEMLKNEDLDLLQKWGERTIYAAGRLRA
jgi:hypothetical protein